eukprot:1351097-Pyramimonas_sp.AAC.1
MYKIGSPDDVRKEINAHHARNMATIGKETGAPREQFDIDIEMPTRYYRAQETQQRAPSVGSLKSKVFKVVLHPAVVGAGFYIVSRIRHSKMRATENTISRANAPAAPTFQRFDTSANSRVVLPRKWPVVDNDAPTADDAVPTVPSPPAPDSALDDIAPTVDDAMPTMPSPPAPDSALDEIAPTIVDNDASTVDDAMPT